MKTKFPAAEGWLRLDLTLSTKKPFSEETIKDFVSNGKPDEYEWGPVEQYGNKVKAVYRKKPTPEPAAPEKDIVITVADDPSFKDARLFNGYFSEWKAGKSAAELLKKMDL